MTVNDFKETTCATATREEMEAVEHHPHVGGMVDSENLLGRVLAGKKKN